jgi:hypothetical protein
MLRSRCLYALVLAELEFVNGRHTTVTQGGQTDVELEVFCKRGNGMSAQCQMAQAAPGYQRDTPYRVGGSSFKGSVCINYIAAFLPYTMCDLKNALKWIGTESKATKFNRVNSWRGTWGL